MLTFFVFLHCTTQRTMQNLNIAYIQADLAWEDKATNLKRFGQLLEQVKPDTDLILLPETFTTAFPVDPKRFAETVDGPTMQWLREQARAKKAVVCTTFPLDVDGHYYNSLVWMRPDGSYELYFKRHTFTMGGEDQLVERGEKQLIVELNGWRIKRKKPLCKWTIRIRPSLLSRQLPRLEDDCMEHAFGGPCHREPSLLDWGKPCRRRCQ